MNELHLFCGVGGGVLGGMLLGHTCVCAVEIEEYPRRVLLQRQRDGILPRFPIWDDIRTFDGRPWRGRVDVVCGGFPCQDISSARTNSRENGKQMGLAGSRSGLWSEMRRVIEEVQPYAVKIENSPNLRTKGLVRVIKDLADLGYVSRWGRFGVRGFGADHIRNRIFIIATNSDLPQCEGRGVSVGIHQEHANSSGSDWWKGEPGMERVAHGVARSLDRLKAIGNGQVPALVRLAWNALK
jgi:DNA (cytosine-5)-methyltransferase 1